MAKPKSNREISSEAARVMAALYVFDSVVAILENGNVVPSQHRISDKIIALSKSAQQKLLAEYDKLQGEIT